MAKYSSSSRELEMARFDWGSRTEVSEGTVNIKTLSKNITPEAMKDFLVDGVNGGELLGNAPEQVGELLAQEHRQLQADVVRWALRVLEGYVKANPGTDPRNEVMVAMARGAVAGAEKALNDLTAQRRSARR